MAKRKVRKYSILLPTGKTRAPKTVEERSVIDLLRRFDGLTENAQWAFCLALIHRGDTFVSKKLVWFMESAMRNLEDCVKLFGENMTLERKLRRRRKSNALADAKAIRDRMAKEGKSLHALAGDSASKYDAMRKTLKRADKLEEQKRKHEEELARLRAGTVTNLVGTCDGPSFMVHFEQPGD